MDHPRKNKNQVSISLSSARGSGGIAGLLVFGGALAVTGLIAVASFASNKKKNHNHNNKANTPKSPVVEPEPQESDDTISTTNDENARFETSNKSVDQVDSFKLLSTPALVLEEELDPKVNEEIATGLHQEIALSDDNSPPESAVSSNDNIMAAEQCLESSFDIPCFKAEYLDKSESQEPLKSIAIKEGQYEDDATTETADEEDDDVGIETSENSSEATGRTSMDADEAAVWPAELIEEPKREVKEENLNIHSEAEAIVKPKIGLSDSDDGSDRDILSELISYEKANLSVPMNHQLSESHLSKSRAWNFPMVLLVLALLFCFWYCAPIAFKSLFMF